MKNIFFATLIMVVACSPSAKINRSAGALLSENYIAGGKIFTSLYQQKAAEYRALCLQAYNIAMVRINNYVSQGGKPLAIVTDIDETLLDNSPYAVHQALRGKDYEPASWYEWTERAEADSMPGAPALLKYARSKGIEIFYVTNRDQRERDATLKNLQRFQFPNADTAHLMLRENTSSKEVRRQRILQTHDVVFFMGDNLADFSAFFDKKNLAERSANTDMLAAQFGQKFIVLPNPNYGDWEGAIYNYNYKFSSAEKDSVIRVVLRNY